MMFPKIDYVRSARLMGAYRLIPCQCCGRDDGTVVGAHSNQAIHGKGRSIKASDQYCASLCTRCHAALDQGRDMNRAERNLLWYLAHIKTVQLLRERNLWPKDIPTPTMELPE